MQTNRFHSPSWGSRSSLSWNWTIMLKLSVAWQSKQGIRGNQQGGDRRVPGNWTSQGPPGRFGVVGRGGRHHLTGRSTPSLRSPPSRRCRYHVPGVVPPQWEPNVHAHMHGRQKVENRISRQTERTETSVGPRSTAAFPPCHLPTKLIVSVEATSFFQAGDSKTERERERY